MKSRKVLGVADVKTILEAAQAHAQAKGWAVAISVVDDGGHLLGMLRLDDTAPISTYISQAKAHTAALGRRESRLYEEVINGGRHSFMTVPQLQGMLEGGVPIIVDGDVVGAVGVSGVKSHEDVEIGRAGIAALGL
jgi:glc operon protein GlcG